MHFGQDPKYYSCNQGYQKYWSEGVKRFTDHLQGFEDNNQALGTRYMGSLVGDFHRNLISGGIFYYPADKKDPSKTKGKLRLVYEAAPLAFIAEQAGGYASDGTQPILDIMPDTLHQRTPLFVGNTHLVQLVEEYIRKYG